MVVRNVFLYSWNEDSQGARSLAEAMDIRRIRHRGSRFTPSPDKLVINWGSSTGLDQYRNRLKWLNHPSYVTDVQNKLWFFRNQERDSEARLVPWTTSREVAQRWNREGSYVVVRNVLTGHSGNGIVIVPPSLPEPELRIPQAPLYTKYIKKDMEFRVHIVNGEIIDTQRKVRDPNRTPTNWQVRSHDNGFIYIRKGLDVPDDVRRQAITAFNASGLDFGAVDLISVKGGLAYVLEINSAPGLEGQTVTKYAEALLGLSQERLNG